MTWRSVPRPHKIPQRTRSFQPGTERVFAIKRRFEPLHGGRSGRCSELWTRPVSSKSGSGQATGCCASEFNIFGCFDVKGVAAAEPHFVKSMKEPTRDRSYSTDLQVRMRSQAVRLGGMVVTILILSLLVPLFIKIAVQYLL
jgi:hypothetical protein